ncbi:MULTISPECIES: hypothetical protein [Pantoea]|uniref:hypothetical protein n=1 Tax=Pantoea TaxID=53335 RepID=UPI001CA61325|nr:hypothetical protein [Pantoea dispersa]QZY94361.1 hypothetical protein K7X52_16875 [Pantoea dispersa]
MRHIIGQEQLYAEARGASVYAAVPEARRRPLNAIIDRSTSGRLADQAISYVNQSMFGQGAVAANALLRMISVWFALSGGQLWCRSHNDGHSGLKVTQANQQK